MLISLALTVGGLVLLILGARFLVDGASALASRLGVHPAAVGLTVVAFGTSTPELIVNVAAALDGVSAISFGNVVGSNLFNTAVILGLSALIAPLAIHKRTTRFEVPLALLAVAAVIVAAGDPWLGEGATAVIGRSEGALLLGFFLVFTSYTLSLLREESGADQPAGPNWAPGLAVLASILGVGLLFLGGELTVRGAVEAARLLQISERIIAITIISAGTSLPELVTSVVAARRGQNDLAVSNVVGSNIFNVFFVLGLSAVITPVSVEPGGLADLVALLAVSLLVFLFIFTRKGRRIDRWEGGALLGAYAVYLVYLLRAV
ncbi:MAG: calcium/sodium antiporter [Spirochaetaceae bacterium]